MRQVFAVYKRELGLYFHSPIAYALGFAVLLFFGLLFNSYLSQVVTYNFSVAQQQGAGGVTADDLIGFVPRLFSVLLFIVGPLLTMRLISEEAREGTLEVLMTLPMNESAFVIGKFLAVWTFYSVLLGLTFVYAIILRIIGQPDLGLVFGGYFGAWLYGGAVLAITMIWSAVTEDQIVAAFLGAATVLVLYFGESAVVWASSQGALSGLVDVIRDMSLTPHYDDTMLQGVIYAKDLVYFLVVMVGALFITIRLVEIRRWRG